MKRRAFMMAVAGAAASWPLAARAQQGRRIGVLLTALESDQAAQSWLASFRRRLRELGWGTDGDIRFETRWAGGDHERMRVNIAEICASRPMSLWRKTRPW
jgi:putative tryptophan/tyrosine transport system substrate-binding protein